MTNGQHNQTTSSIPLGMWQVQDQLATLIRDLCGTNYPFRLQMTEYEWGYLATVILREQPSARLAAEVDALQAVLAAQGVQVEVSYRKADVDSVIVPEYESAKKAFDEVWAHLTEAEATDKKTGSAPIRDFLYLDLDRLASYYAQSMKGLTTLIARREVGQQHAGVSNDLTFASYAAERLQEESSVLHDYMYNLLEQHLKEEIVQVKARPNTTLSELETLRSVLMCKVQGTLAIQDYERMAAFVDQFNTLGEAVAYALIQSGAARQTEGQGSTSSSKSGNRSRSHSMSSKDVAQKMGLRQEGQLLKNIKLFAELFYSNGYDLLLSPPEAKGKCAFRAVIDRTKLRIPPDRLRVVHGSPTQTSWTLVGTVTYVTGPEQESKTNTVKAGSATGPGGAGQAASMRPAFHQMFDAMGEFERIFVSNAARAEAIVLPLAIYRELGT